MRGGLLPGLIAGCQRVPVQSIQPVVKRRMGVEQLLHARGLAAKGGHVLQHGIK